MKRVCYDVDGNILSVLEAGNKNHPVVIFIHGIPANATLWLKTIEQVSEQGYYTLAFDMPGFGETQVVEDKYYGIKGTAALINKWIHQQGFSDIWLVAHDIGGGVAQYLVTFNEVLYKKLTISNSIAADSWPVDEMNVLIDLARSGQFTTLASESELPQGLAQFIKSTFVNKGEITEQLMSTVFIDRKCTSISGRNNFSALLASLDNSDTVDIMTSLRNVKTPTHLIWAMQDPHQPWDGPGVLLKKTLNVIKVSKIEQSGHFLQLDAKDEYLKHLLS
ncbi:hypothetical protein C9J01_01875 [Photobacterium rosenbergii]|uniref:AB hydrolase-1 domain-containing protein n=1 Tax=Photobacterium rosenbergii TaxID=294936 RepID=A0A2T3NJV3_9GAMM|nr:alpha/beta hydrolase [Photobacterium rosenbergii]PSW15788.1 hypothetical protein C9J01_01875 [Photobacterium rosenbergii]